MDIALKLPNAEADYPFKQHHQFAMMTDILIRKYRHHIHLQVDLSPCAIKYFLEAFLTYLKMDSLPFTIREMQYLYISATNIDINAVTSFLLKSDKHTLLIIDDISLLDTEKLLTLLNFNNCRSIIISNNATKLKFLDNFFIPVEISQEDKTESIHILQQEKISLESFHQVTIPNDVIENSFNLAARYISTQQILEHTLLILDSAAARCKGDDLIDSQITPVLTMIMVHNVLSNKTGIAIEHFQSDITSQYQYLKENFFAQDAALELIHAALKQRQDKYPISFLLIGHHHSGKKTLTEKLAQALYLNTNMVYKYISHNDNEFIYSKFKSSNQKEIRLYEILQQIPYAILIIENLELMQSRELDQLLITGEITYENKILKVQNCIFVFTSTLGSDKLQTLVQKINFEPKEEVDLFKLVLNEDKEIKPDLSGKALVKAILPELTVTFSKAFLEKSHIIPLLPLDNDGREKIIQYYLKEYANQLKAKFDIELSCAHEIIRFINNNVLRHENDFNKALMPIYKLIEQTIQNAGHKGQLLHLQLNEDGQMLTIQWVTPQNVQANVINN